MTTIGQGQASALTTTIGAAFLEGVATQLGAGIRAIFSNPLGAGPLAFGKLPNAFGVTCGIVKGDCALPEPKASWTTQMTGSNTAKIDLGDGSRLEIDERSSELTIINDNTGQRTRIWGDPHVEVNGQHKFDFWGTSTFTLANGTKVTINTEQWAGNPNAYVASQVVITKGSNAIVVDGISQNKLGDLSITQSNTGYALDTAHRDGWTVHEQAGSTGWATEMGNQATQTDANVTAIGAEYGPGSQTLSMAEAAPAMGAFLLFGTFAGALFMSNFGSQSDSTKTSAEAMKAPSTTPSTMTATADQPKNTDNNAMKNIFGDPGKAREDWKKVWNVTDDRYQPGVFGMPYIPDNTFLGLKLK